MSDSFRKLNLNIEKLISDYFCENQKSIEDINKENEELRNKIKELQYELKLSQLKIENLELKLELSTSKENSVSCDDVTKVSNKRQFSRRLFANFEASSEKSCSEILARDTCAVFGNERTNQCESVMKSEVIDDDDDDELSMVYDSKLDNEDNQFAKYNKDDQLSIETQLSQEKEMPSWSDNEIDLDETMIDCDYNENENEENESPISFSPKTPDRSIKYVGPTVRKKTERQALVGFDCVECRKYYEAIGETDSQIQTRIQQCSRHRARYVPPSTPEGFWNIGIPEPAEEPEVKVIKLAGRRGKKMQLPDRKWIQ